MIAISLGSRLPSAFAASRRRNMVNAVRQGPCGSAPTFLTLPHKQPLFPPSVNRAPLGLLPRYGISLAMKVKEVQMAGIQAIANAVVSKSPF